MFPNTGQPTWASIFSPIWCIWGTSILDSPHGSFQTPAPQNKAAWVQNRRKRLQCNIHPTRRSSIFLMLLSTFIVDAKWHWQILGLMAHMATIAILVLGVGWFQTCSFLWAHIHVNQQKLAASVFLFSVSVARWNTVQVPGWQQYYWHVDWGQGCQSWS